MFFLPPRPNYEQLCKQAKELYKACLAGDAAAVKRMCAHHPNFSTASDAATATLADAQLAVASQHGLGSSVHSTILRQSSAKRRRCVLILPPLTRLAGGTCWKPSTTAATSSITRTAMWLCPTPMPLGRGQPVRLRPVVEIQ